MRYAARLDSRAAQFNSHIQNRKLKSGQEVIPAHSFSERFLPLQTEALQHATWRFARLPIRQAYNRSMSEQTNQPEKKHGLAWFFSFPNPVNEASSRIVAGMAAGMGIAFIITGQPWILAILAYGFLAHVTSGPKFSPIGLLTTKVIVPALGWYKPVPGPPKRFAQGIGLVFSTTALALALSGMDTAAKAMIGVLIAFATLESVFAFCAGCFVFNRLMRIGLIPESVCRECADALAYSRARSADKSLPIK